MLTGLSFSSLLFSSSSSPLPSSAPLCRRVSTVVLLGEGRVGKTCLCLRYVQNSFSSDQESTIQATYLDKRLNVGKRSVKLMIWSEDTEERERTHSSSNSAHMTRTSLLTPHCTAVVRCAQGYCRTGAISFSRTHLLSVTQQHNTTHTKTRSTTHSRAV